MQDVIKKSIAVKLQSYKLGVSRLGSLEISPTQLQHVGVAVRVNNIPVCVLAAISYKMQWL